MQELSGRTAFVTGGASGIGLALGRAFAEAGMKVMLADIETETLRVTTARAWQPGTVLNLERALRLGDELGGHLVSGHVDGLAKLTRREDLPDMARLSVRAPAELARFIAAKGSVALDGVSLTVNEVKGERFSVLIIPHTLKVTTFGALSVGAPMNLEVDLMARYAARLLQARPSRASR